MTYDNWLLPPDPEFGSCVYCHESEEIHTIVDIDEGARELTTMTVCPAYADLAVAIEDDYPFELVYPDSTIESWPGADVELIETYEIAIGDIQDNLYEDDDGEDW